METYEEWDMTIPSIPSRSRFYCLEPIGIGTPFVENLTSYVARLARIHCVLPKELVYREILPTQGITKDNLNFYDRLNAFWLEDSGYINGVGPVTERWLKALQSLTFRSDLRYLTMSTWSEVVFNKGLVRLNKAWCPYCYEEHRKSQRTIYDCLLWSLNAVDVCPLHRKPLITTCAICQQPQSFLMQSTLMGYCSRCGNWLGSGSEILLEETTALRTEDLEKQTWIADAVGKLLAAAPSFLIKPPKEQIAIGIKNWIKSYTEYPITSLASYYGFNCQDVVYYIGKGTLPKFEHFLRLCFALSINPLDFLRRRVTQHPSKITLKSDYSSNVRLDHKKRTHLKSEELQTTKLYLEALLKEKPILFPSLTDIALKLGCSVDVLQDHFPDLCQLILTRRRPQSENLVENARLELENALASTKPISLNEVLRRLNCGRRFLTGHFPDLCQKVVTRYRERFNHEDLRAHLQEVLISGEIKSVKEITCQLGYKTTLAYDRFPDLSKQIMQSYRAMKKQQHDERIKNICDEVKQAIFTLHEQELYPSYRQVTNTLNNAHLFMIKEVREMYKKVMQDLGYTKE